MISTSYFYLLSVKPGPVWMHTELISWQELKKDTHDRREVVCHSLGLFWFSYKFSNVVASFDGSLIYLCGSSHKSCLFFRDFTQVNKIVRILVLQRRVFRLEMAFKLTWDHSTVVLLCSVSPHTKHNCVGVFCSVFCSRLPSLLSFDFHSY